MLSRKVPKKGTNWLYTLGSATMFAFLSQAVTGVFLAMYYDPNPLARLRQRPAHHQRRVPRGASCAACTAGARHVMIWSSSSSTLGASFFFGAYKYPRELNWIIGVILLVLTLLMGFTGYLLPFDQRSFWATVVEREPELLGPAHRPVPGGLPARRAGFGAYHAEPLLRDAHAADPRPDRSAHRRAHLYLVAKLGTTAPPWLKAKLPEPLEKEKV